MSISLLCTLVTVLDIGETKMNETLSSRSSQNNKETVAKANTICIQSSMCKNRRLSIVLQGQERRGDLSAWVDQEGSIKRHSC